MRRRRFVKKSSPKRLALFMAIAAGGGAAVLALLLGLAVGLPHPPAYLSGQPKKAAIIDQVGLTFPNEEFLNQAQDYLEEGGFAVDIYKDEEVTVDFYRTLPQKGYQLILLRSHATNLYNGAPGGPDAIFTAQPYQKNQYVIEQITDQVAAARVVYGDSPTRYFSIMANFVRHSMEGRFNGTLIILGGCQTLATGDLGKALLEKGASGVIGWNEMVTLTHNDQALLLLVRNLVVERQPIPTAVGNTMAALGLDPRYRSFLTFLP